MKKRLLMCYNSTQYGGIEFQILDIISGLSQEIDIYVASKEGPLKDDYLKAGAKEFIQLYPKSEFDISYVQNIKKLLDEKNIDIIHAHELKTGVLAMIAGFLAHTSKRVYHVHTPFLYWSHIGLKKYFATAVNWVANILAANLFATDVLALTPSVKDVRVNKEWVKASKVKVIPNTVKAFVEPSADKIQSFRDRYNLGSDAFVYGNISRMTIEKGHRYMIEAFAKVAKEINEAKLILIGSGELQEELQDLTKRLEIANQVIFTGALSDEDRIAVMKLMDVFVFPSLAEGFGIVLLEAMSLGIPSVSSDLPVLKDVAEDAVVYFKKSDVNNLSEQMINLYTNSELRDELSCKSKQISSKYTREKFWDNYRKLYLEL